MMLKSIVVKKGNHLIICSTVHQSFYTSIFLLSHPNMRSSSVCFSHTICLYTRPSLTLLPHPLLQISWKTDKNQEAATYVTRKPQILFFFLSCIKYEQANSTAWEYVQREFVDVCESQETWVLSTFINPFSPSADSCSPINPRRPAPWFCSGFYCCWTPAAAVLSSTGMKSLSSEETRVVQFNLFAITLR